MDAGSRAPATGSRRKLAHDLRTLATFIEIHCHGRHGDRPRAPVELRSHDIGATVGHVPQLCDACRRLLAHAFVKRTRCPLDPKPMCKKCPVHCYAPKYRHQIRRVMRYAGMRLLVTGRLHYLWHLVA
ncbi:MAG: nitrous oxide-stimulated promoter family protein [Candidatus Eiseniibacteriota bacterium]|jgi:hypothetical protein